MDSQKPIVWKTLGIRISNLFSSEINCFGCLVHLWLEGKRERKAAEILVSFWKSFGFEFQLTMIAILRSMSDYLADKKRYKIDTISSKRKKKITTKTTLFLFIGLWKCTNSIFSESMLTKWECDFDMFASSVLQFLTVCTNIFQFMKNKKSMLKFHFLL